MDNPGTSGGPHEALQQSSDLVIANAAHSIGVLRRSSQHPAPVGTGGLVLFSGVSYLRSPDKSLMDTVKFFGASAIDAALFIFIFRLFAPQYLGMFGSMLPTFLRP